MSSNTFAFTNGTYDFDTNKFTPTRPKHGTVTVDYDYLPLNEQVLVAKEHIRTVIMSIVDGESDANYLLSTIAQSLLDNHSNEILYFWKGNVKYNDGRSVVKSLIEATYGDYCYSMDVKYLERRESKSFSLDKIMPILRNYKIVFAPEQKSRVTYSIGRIKKLASKKSIQYSKGKTSFCFTPKFNAFVEIDHDIKFDTTLESVSNRFSVLRFPYEFVADPKEINLNEKSIAPILALADKVKTHEYKIGFFHLLLEYCQKLKSNVNRVMIPDNVAREVDKVMTDNDTINPFINDKLIITNDKNDKIGLFVMNSKYESYCTSLKMEPHKDLLRSILKQSGVKCCSVNDMIYYTSVKFNPSM